MVRLALDLLNRLGSQVLKIFRRALQLEHRPRVVLRRHGWLAVRLRYQRCDLRPRLRLALEQLLGSSRRYHLLGVRLIGLEPFLQLRLGFLLVAPCAVALLALDELEAGNRLAGEQATLHLGTNRLGHLLDHRHRAHRLGELLDVDGLVDHD